MLGVTSSDRSEAIPSSLSNAVLPSQIVLDSTQKSGKFYMIGQNDGKVDGDTTLNAEVRILSSSDARFAYIRENAMVTYEFVNTDTQSVLVDTKSASLVITGNKTFTTESGGTATFNVSLSDKPFVRLHSSRLLAQRFPISST